MSDPDRPQLRPYLALARLDPLAAQGKEFLLHDRLRLSSAHLAVNAAELECLRLFDGTRTLRDIQADVTRLFDGQIVPLEVFRGLAERLDQALFLDSPAFRRVADGPVRPPCCVGVYDADPVKLRQQMHELFRHPLSSGPPGDRRDGERLRAVLAPHIDYHRGGPVYTYAFKELVESTPASLFVIIGTSHYCPWKRFTLTRKDFRTPLGVVPTDQAFIDRLVSHYGPGLFDDEWVAHLPEHSIELEVVLLHYLYEGKRDVRIVPLVVGSFEDCVSSSDSPSRQDDLRRMAEALQAAERETAEPICYIISGDLAHIGPKFGAREPVREAQLRHSRAQDLALLVQTEKADPEGYFRVIAEERDERNICGLPPTWLTLAAAKPSHGRVLKYDQYVEPSGHESVSFASVAFYG
jgi:AmmeMemoRadiSam system protein B